MLQDEIWMREALGEAKIASDCGEIPVGAVLVDQNGCVLAKTHNLTETNRDALSHAELLAILSGCRQKGNRRLSDCTLYVTLEPCPMCAGAILNARIPRVVYAAKDPRAGALGSLLDLRSYPLESRPTVDGGIGEAESLSLLRDFFQTKRREV